jgi:hypothetical protein
MQPDYEALSAISEPQKCSISPGKPSFFPLIESYLRRFRTCSGDCGDDLMPADKRIIRALNGVYDDADTPDKAVLRGTFEGDARDYRQRYNMLLFTKRHIGPELQWRTFCRTLTRKGRKYETEEQTGRGHC